MSSSETLTTSTQRFKSPLEAPTFAIYTLGCKINQYDSNRMADRMRKAGFQQVPFKEAADAYIIDTCTVTHVADRKSRNAVRRAIRKNLDAVIAVTGCAAEWAKDDFLKIHERSIVVGNQEKEALPAMVERAIRAQKTFNFTSTETELLDGPYRMPQGTRTRAILKVMEGCNRVCSFCIIPSVRGKPYSRPMEEVLTEARQIVKAGAREIVITGVIAGWYGTDLPSLESNPSSRSRGGQLDILLKRLHEIEGLERLRLSTLDPRDLSDGLIQVFSEYKKVCPYLHLALQSGCEEILSSMRRGYTKAHYAERVRSLRKAVPGISLHTDIMVGFPGETEAHFQESKAFVEEMKFAGMHVFPYSARPRTDAPNLPDQVSPTETNQRGKVLGSLAQQMKSTYALPFTGKRATVLIEKIKADGSCEGFTEHYIPTHVTAGHNALVGDLINVELLRWDGNHMIATQLKVES